MILQPHSWAYIQRKTWVENICTPTFIASTVLSGQDMETNSLNVHQTNG